MALYYNKDRPYNLFDMNFLIGTKVPSGRLRCNLALNLNTFSHCDLCERVWDKFQIHEAVSESGVMNCYKSNIKGHGWLIKSWQSLSLFNNTLSFSLTRRHKTQMLRPNRQENIWTLTIDWGQINWWWLEQTLTLSALLSERLIFWQDLGTMSVIGTHSLTPSLLSIVSVESAISST